MNQLYQMESLQMEPILSEFVSEQVFKIPYLKYLFTYKFT
jgi:hypothetical protein